MHKRTKDLSHRLKNCQRRSGDASQISIQTRSYHDILPNLLRCTICIILNIFDFDFEPSSAVLIAHGNNVKQLTRQSWLTVTHLHRHFVSIFAVCTIQRIKDIDFAIFIPRNVLSEKSSTQPVMTDGLFSSIAD